jgi:hypothetical protein
VTQHQEAPLSARESGQGFLKLGRNIRARLFGLLRESISEMLGAAGPAAQFVETSETDAAVKPDPKRASITAKTGSRGDEFEERLLDCIFGGATVAEHSECKRSESVDGGFVHRPVGGVGPSTDPVDQLIQLVIVGQPCFLGDVRVR